MSPTIVDRRPDGRSLVTGGAGGSRIIMGALLTTLNRLEFSLDVAQAVDAERLDAQASPVLIEDARVDPAVIAELERRGHTFRREGEYAIRPRVQAAGARLRGRAKDAVSDPRTESGSLAERRR